MRRHTLGSWFAMCLLAARPSLAQSPARPVAPDAEFEVVSVKPITLEANTFQRGMGRSAPTDFRTPATTVDALLLRAFTLQPYQLIGEPAWTHSEFFEVQAKGGEGRRAEDIPAMLRSMLRSRFALRSHHETRDLPGSVLSLAREDGRLGSRIKPASQECVAEAEAQDAARQAFLKGGQPPPPPPVVPRSLQELERQLDEAQPCGASRGLGKANGSMRQRMNTVPMTVLVGVISRELGGPVVDATGLTGRFDIDLEYVSERGIFGGAIPAPRAGLSATAPGADAEILPPPLRAALKEQLGLKVEQSITPVDVLVIESLERPQPD